MTKEWEKEKINEWILGLIAVGNYNTTKQAGIIYELTEKALNNGEGIINSNYQSNELDLTFEIRLTNNKRVSDCLDYDVPVLNDEYTSTEGK